MYDPERMEAEAQRDVADGFTAVRTGAWVGDSALPKAEWIAAGSTWPIGTSSFGTMSGRDGTPITTQGGLGA